VLLVGLEAGHLLAVTSGDDLDEPALVEDAELALGHMDGQDLAGVGEPDLDPIAGTAVPSLRASKGEIMTGADSAGANVVLVHGGFVDGSGWQAVYELLKLDGHRVSVVQNPTLSLQGDVAATRWVLDAQDGPVVLVGHSYGGAVITEAGTHDKVAALVYIAAFAPDKGESVNTLIADPPPGAPVPADPAATRRVPAAGP
jgi:pimeloyl-ACP methyl ester carboxylesterase